jgi:hypothetical protein
MIQFPTATAARTGTSSVNPATHQQHQRLVTRSLAFHVGVFLWRRSMYGAVDEREGGRGQIVEAEQ